MAISEASGRVLARLLESRTGQQLAASRHWRIEPALKTLMRDHGFGVLDDLIASLPAGRPSALADAVVEALLNNETYFFRDRQLFGLLSRAIARVERLRATEKRLAIWCAGCSTGQEAYSLAMNFAEDSQRWNGWSIEILATDISRATIERAREGVYSQFEIQRGLPAAQMLRWFTQESQDQWRISSALRRSVRFEVRGLSESLPEPGIFDVILCRNVLLYLSPEMRRQAFERLAAASVPETILMLGAAETVIGQTDRFAPDPDFRGLHVLTAGRRRRYDTERRNAA